MLTSRQEELMKSIFIETKHNCKWETEHRMQRAIDTSNQLLYATNPSLVENTTGTTDQNSPHSAVREQQ